MGGIRGVEGVWILVVFRKCTAAKTAAGRANERKGIGHASHL